MNKPTVLIKLTKNQLTGLFTITTHNCGQSSPRQWNPMHCYDKQLICHIMSIASTHCRQGCFALLHPDLLFSVHHLWCSYISETLWIPRRTFSFAPRVVSDPQNFSFFLYLFFFPLFISNLKFPIFYLSMSCSWFLLCLADILCTLHCPFLVLSEILTVLRKYFPSLPLQRSFLSPFLSSTLGDINLHNSTERQGRTKLNGLHKLTGYWLSGTFSHIFFNGCIIRRYWVLPVWRKRNVVKLRGRNLFALRPKKHTSRVLSIFT